MIEDTNQFETLMYLLTSSLTNYHHRPKSNQYPSMRSVKPAEDLNISLEPHLVDTLQPLQAIAPQELAHTLSQYTSSSPSPTIPYSLLQSVSKWARTTAGLETLRSQSPPLDPHAYSMIALLAGTTTSPERKLGAYVPPPAPEEIEAARLAERKSITALLNALLSIVGSGFAVWWAADKLRWKNEWRVLLALLAGIVVAVAEAVLYLIWQSQRSMSTTLKPRRRAGHVSEKKDDGYDGADSGERPESISTSVEEVTDGTLRRRQ
ncbi:hypothetical protein D9615_007460 [Tricholomella constricta]|uniref:Uncharacterized protein n=1 Tax=Tricholomella constricta TaxID=117010 RepID=A0A8H5LXV1_9AGAR|nr:hypothetical protein D9615_007460 [Tricholomella constricta]